MAPARPAWGVGTREGWGVGVRGVHGRERAFREALETAGLKKASRPLPACMTNAPSDSAPSHECSDWKCTAQPLASCAAAPASWTSHMSQTPTTPITAAATISSTWLPLAEGARQAMARSQGRVGAGSAAYIALTVPWLRPKICS